MNTKPSLASRILSARDALTLLDDPGVADADAYVIQDELTALRTARGEQRRGWKLGYTSAAMREQMGIAQPNFGPLTNAMLLQTGAVVTRVVHPKVEPEVAVEIAEDGSFRYRAAIEVVDSVWSEYRFTWASNTADGSSATFVVLGPELPSAEIEAELIVNGEQVATGHSSAAMGHPDNAMAWLAEQLDARRDSWSPGDVVITGGLTKAHSIEVGDSVVARFGGVEVQMQRGEA